MKVIPVAYRVLVRVDKSKKQKELEETNKKLADLNFVIAKRSDNPYDKNSFNIESEQKRELAAMKVGVVEAIGPTAFKVGNNKIEWFKVGDRVLFDRHAGVIPPSAGNKDNLQLRILSDDQIIAVLEMSDEEYGELDNE